MLNGKILPAQLTTNVEQTPEMAKSGVAIVTVSFNAKTVDTI